MFSGVDLVKLVHCDSIKWVINVIHQFNEKVFNEPIEISNPRHQ